MSERTVIEEARALTPRGTVLVVDDEPSVCASVRAILDGTCRVLEAEDGAAAMEQLRRHDVDLVLLDERMPGEAGLDVLARIKAFDVSIVVALVSAVHEVRTVVEALKRGAYDYLTKPFGLDEITMLVHRALEKRALEREVLCLRSELTVPGHEGGGFRPMIGRHRTMVRIYQLVAQIAGTPTTVLITGESGTGKELVARALHHQSPRRAQPFVAVNVAAIPDTLIESELFGHERGAFTGAVARKLGKFELAQGGTVFLDEIGSLRLDLQAKLLRVLQEREIERVGGVRPAPVDVRVLAATNTNLRQAVRQRAFREDLYYRLNVVPVLVPPLRDRRDDIPLLVEHFITKFSRECRRDVRGISAGALDTLAGYDWPGNVRELENVIHRAVVLARGPVLQMQDVPLDVAMPGNRFAPGRRHRSAPGRRPGPVRAPISASRPRAGGLEREPRRADARGASQHRPGQALGVGHPSSRERRPRRVRLMPLRLRRNARSTAPDHRVGRPPEGKQFPRRDQHSAAAGARHVADDADHDHGRVAGARGGQAQRLRVGHGSIAAPVDEDQSPRDARSHPLRREGLQQRGEGAQRLHRRPPASPLSRARRRGGSRRSALAAMKVRTRPGSWVMRPWRFPNAYSPVRK